MEAMISNLKFSQIPIEVASICVWIFVVSNGTKDGNLMVKRNFVLLGVMFGVEASAHIYSIYLSLKIPMIVINDITHIERYLTLSCVGALIVNQSIPYSLFLYRYFQSKKK